MWSSMMAPQGSGFSGNFLTPKGVTQQQYREFNMTVIKPGKSFKNPNFVNNFNKYQHFDSCSVHTNLKNPCHIHIIDSIKERCPEVIPHLVENEEKEEPSPSASDIRCEMCLDNNTMHQHRKREHTPRKKTQVGKKSRHNIKRKELRDIMLVEDQDLSNHSLDNSFTPKPHSLILKDFIMPIRLCETLAPLQKMEPVTTKVFLTVSPLPTSRTPQYSVTDGKDSFVVFDHDDVSETTMETKDDTNACRESLNQHQRRRIPSLCESEDSFIMFERDEESDNLDSIEDGDSLEGTSTEGSDQDSSDDDAEESGCDEIDFSFSIIDRKKVRFASPDKLCEVHPMVKWSYAYQAARKGPWEMYARDRSRFKDRAWRVERDIKHVFDPVHRDRVYRERFEDL